jgi:hypothetical protein
MSIQSRLDALERQAALAAASVCVLWEGEQPFIGGSQPRAGRVFCVDSPMPEMSWCTQDVARLTDPAWRPGSHSLPRDLTERLADSERARLLYDLILVLLWSPEVVAVEAANLVGVIRQYGEQDSLPDPLPLEPHLQAYLDSDWWERCFNVSNARGEGTEMEIRYIKPPYAAGSS